MRAQLAALPPPLEEQQLREDPQAVPAQRGQAQEGLQVQADLQAAQETPAVQEAPAPVAAQQAARPLQVQTRSSHILLLGELSSQQLPCLMRVLGADVLIDEAFVAGGADAGSAGGEAASGGAAGRLKAPLSSLHSS